MYSLSITYIASPYTLLVTHGNNNKTLRDAMIWTSWNGLSAETLHYMLHLIRVLQSTRLIVLVSFGLFGLFTNHHVNNINVTLMSTIVCTTCDVH